MSRAGLSLLIAETFKPSCCLLAGEGGTSMSSLRCVGSNSLNRLASMPLQVAKGVLKVSNLCCRALKSALRLSG